jgi:DnaJ-domain-containing protein 1
MKQYLKNRLRSLIFKRSIVQIISLIVLIVVLLMIIILNGKSLNTSYLIGVVIVAAVVITATSFKRNYKISFRSEDVEMLKIVIVFMRMKRANIELNTLYIKGIFNPYKEKKLFELVNYYKDASYDHEESMKMLSFSPYDLKIFLIETLLDIALSDGVLTNKEEVFLNTLSNKLEVNSYTFERIKLDYVKKGLNKEASRISGNNGNRKDEPYNLMSACSTLNVTPTVSSKQLKKAYRTMVKRYHPDRYHGKGEEMIKTAQIKFHEIKSAYEIIMIHKGFN